MTQPHQDASKWNAQAEMLCNRIAKNHRKLRSWLNQEQITCFRMYNRDIPEIPLAVDNYEGRLHISDYSPKSKPEGWMNPLVNALSERLEIPSAKIFVKRHYREKGGTQYQSQKRIQNLITVTEGGLSFLVNLTDYLDTGLFLDHRKTRSLIRKEAAGKRFLNLFAYTGAFSVYAASGGAASTTTVDLSNTYLDWAEDNMRLNGFSDATHTYVRDDILGALEGNAITGTYDLAIIDPPTVSKSKAMDRDFDIQRDHVVMLKNLYPRIAKGGAIYFSTNYSRFKLATDETVCKKAIEITRQITSRDFSGRQGLRCWRIEVD